MLYLLILILILLLVWKETSDENPQPLPAHIPTTSNPISPDMNEIVKKVKEKYNDIALKYDAVSFPANQYVSYKDILAIICKESGNHILAGLNSEYITGDSGNSIGIMQVQEGALQDVNDSLGTNYVFTDLRDDDINVLVGSHYLELCFEWAVKRHPKDIRALAVRRYNGGNVVSETNSISMQYYQDFLTFRSLL